ncbi:hypothetical protein F5X71_20335 [Nocardia brasiliensis]|uniref:Uncharacterized protein n=1 Tax=Nocardia brasiliensis TaxID=37326 RepID=A0A6G9XU31_NOCBR|nr:hypothetical protein [Nocardia brasiliensis]QIS04360.1 hypothetical protein F5X71_20335 [Nocardia brasiliensis]
MSAFEHGEGLLDLIAAKDLGEPGVDRVDDLFFAEVNHCRVVDLVGDGVLGGEAASVVGFVVVPVALHPASAFFVDQQSFEGVGVLNAYLAAD